MKTAFIFDIDGTLANAGNRVHFLFPENDELNSVEDLDKFQPDWDAFYKASVDDKPFNDVVDVFRRLFHSGAEMIFVTGRPEKYRKETQEWLSRFVADFDWKYMKLFMRQDGDTRHDVIVKKEIYDREIKDKYVVIGAFEDRSRCVQMWRELGITCFQVKDGDY